MTMTFRPLACGLLAGLLALGAATAAAQAPARLRFSHTVPESDSQHKAALEFSRRVKERTQGGVEIQVFANSQLGNDVTLVTGVRSGTIDIGATGNPFVTGLAPKLNALDLPYQFADAQHAYRTLDGAVGRSLLDELSAHQIKGLAFWEIGFRSLGNNKRPINGAEDIRGLKIRTTPNPSHLKAFQLLGANPQPMPFAEVFGALESGAVDGQENPPTLMLSSKMFEVQKYLSLTRHAYTPLVVIMNKARFDGGGGRRGELPAQAQRRRREGRDCPAARQGHADQREPGRRRHPQGGARGDPQAVHREEWRCSAEGDGCAALRMRA
jgi:TRAP-type transport system periplasmic protein